MGTARYRPSRPSDRRTRKPRRAKNRAKIILTLFWPLWVAVGIAAWKWASDRWTGGSMLSFAIVAWATLFVASVIGVVVSEWYRREMYARRKFRFAPSVRTDLSAVERAEMMRAANGRCFYCGQPSEWLEIEHVVPVIRGGISLPVNLVVACQSCNRGKGTQTGWEFVRYPTDVQRTRFREIDDVMAARNVSRRERRALAEAERRRRIEAANERSRAKRDQEYEMWKRRQWWYRPEDDDPAGRPRG